MTYSPMGLFGSCRLDKDAFKAAHRVSVYGKNLWVIGKRAADETSAEDAADDLADDALKSDWQWYGLIDRPIAVTVIGDAAQLAKFRSAQASAGRTPAQSAGALLPLGTGARYYAISFDGEDGVSEVGWPFIGCPEAPDWAVVDVFAPETAAAVAARKVEEARAGVTALEQLTRQYQQQSAPKSAETPASVTSQRGNTPVPLSVKIFAGLAVVSLVSVIGLVATRSAKRRSGIR